MAVKFCGYCGKQIDDSVSFCPHCGARRNMGQQTDNSNQYADNLNESQKEGKSLNKTLSFVALGSAIIGVVGGGPVLEIVALVLSIMVLKSKERCEKEAKTIAKIALVISIVILVFLIIVVGIAIVYSKRQLL